MPKKLRELDIREVSLRVRAAVDSMNNDDPRLSMLLGFFHNSFLKLAKRMQVPLDTDVLNAVIGDHVTVGDHVFQELRCYRAH